VGSTAPHPGTGSELHEPNTAPVEGRLGYERELDWLEHEMNALQAMDPVSRWADGGGGARRQPVGQRRV
jgi:hypothetical protein